MMTRLAALAVVALVALPAQAAGGGQSVAPTDYFTAFSHCLQLTTYDGCIGITSAQVDAGTISQPTP